MVFAVNPLSVTECAVTDEEFRLDSVPYPVVVPYFTCELEAWSVVQVIVADVAETPLELTALITGIAAGVEKVKFADVAVPAASVDITS